MAVMVISLTSSVQVKSACTASFNEADRCEIAVPVLLSAYPHTSVNEAPLDKFPHETSAFIRNPANLWGADKVNVDPVKVSSGASATPSVASMWVAPCSGDAQSGAPHENAFPELTTAKRRSALIRPNIDERIRVYYAMCSRHYFCL